MAEMIMLPVGDLWQHPDNPRKNLGDLQELADSIRENGIYQNLTVIHGHTRTMEEWIQICKSGGVAKTEAKGTIEGFKKEWPRHKNREALDAICDGLISVGYVMSDDEKKLRDGSHEIFHRDDSEVKDND